MKNYLKKFKIIKGGDVLWYMDNCKRLDCFFVGLHFFEFKNVIN